ncbi:hypothetical protein LguiA_031613 [Lonicera macranthoides]
MFTEARWNSDTSMKVIFLNFYSSHGFYFEMLVTLCLCTCYLLVPSKLSGKIHILIALINNQTNDLPCQTLNPRQIGCINSLLSEKIQREVVIRQN